MSPVSRTDTESSPGGAWFATTQWRIVLDAAAESSPESSAALENLCRIYWYPVYSYIRWRGHDAHAAQDLAQEFFAQHLAKNFIARVDKSKGKFRTYLLTLLNHFLVNQWESARAKKRGGQLSFVSLDDEAAAQRHFGEPVSNLAPEELFDQRWALTVFEHALNVVQGEFVTAGKEEQFRCLREFLEGDREAGGYADAAARLGLSAGAVAVAVHRLRQRFGCALRMVVEQTVLDPADVDAEIRHLLRAMTL